MTFDRAMRDYADAVWHGDSHRMRSAYLLLRAMCDGAGQYAADASRYRWLRAGNGYAPEENFVRGWDELDRLCDEGIAEQEKAKVRA